MSSDETNERLVASPQMPLVMPQTPRIAATTTTTPSKMHSYLLQPTTTNANIKSQSHHQTINLNSFGRSSTLDRKLKPLGLLNERCFMQATVGLTNCINSNPMDSINNNNNANNSYLNNFGYQNELNMQRNSLNLQLKSPNHQHQINNNTNTNSLMRNGSFLRRPLSQEHSDQKQNAQIYSKSHLNELEKNQHIFNINSHVLALTNQLNHSVSGLFFFNLLKNRFYAKLIFQEIHIPDWIDDETKNLLEVFSSASSIFV